MVPAASSRHGTLTGRHYSGGEHNNNNVQNIISSLLVAINSSTGKTNCYLRLSFYDESVAALLAVTRQTDGSGFLESADCTVQLLTTGEFEVGINNLINTRQICTGNYEKNSDEVHVGFNKDLYLLLGVQLGGMMMGSLSLLL